MEKYCGNSKPYIYSAFPENDETSLLLLEKLSDDGVNFWYSGSFGRKDKKRIEGAYGLLLFVNNAFSKSSKFHDIVDTAVDYNKNILCIYLDAVEMTPWINMQLGSQLALFKDNYHDISELSDKLRQAQIFHEMSITDAQKRFQRNRGLSAVFIPIAVVGILFFTVIKPLLIESSSDAQEIIDRYGLSQSDMNNITELHIVGNKVEDNVYSVTYDYQNKDRIIVEYNDDGHRYESEPEDVGILTDDDLEILKLMPNLKKLNLSGQQITSLDGIDNLNIESLKLDCNPISSIVGIEKFKNLKYISLCNTNIKDVRPLLALDNLEQVFLEDTFVDNIDGFEKFTGLKWLSLKGSKVKQLPEFVSLSDFSIDLRGLDISNFEALRNIESYNEFRSDGSLSDIKKSELTGKRVRHFASPCTGIVTIDELDFMMEESGSMAVGYSTLQSLEGIEKFEGVQSVDIRNDPFITDLSPCLNIKSLSGITVSRSMAHLLTDEIRSKIKTIEMVD